jgi:tetratricopeptide (TPR) repeat protein
MANKTVFLVVFFFAFFIYGCAVAKPVSYYQSISGNSAETGSVSPEAIDEWIASGHRAFENEQYETARDFYYRAMMADSGRVDVLVSYGACLTNLGFYENAIQIYNIALSIDPYDYIANSNLALTRQFLAERTEQERNAELQWQQQQRENLNNLVASLNSLAASLDNVQSRQSQSDGTGGSGSGGQGQAGTSSGSSSREDRHIANNPASAQRTYNNYARAAKDHWNNIRNAKRSDEPASRIRELENAYRNCQKQMRDFRLEAQRQGVTIRQDEYETKSPPN